MMLNRTQRSFLVAMLFAIAGIACSAGDAQKNSNVTAANSGRPETSAPHTVPTPRNDFTATDIAKLKWIEGTWRGMDGDKPFYERYKLDGTTLVVTSLKEDGSTDGDPGRFELTNGEFGKTEGDRRSAASKITEKFIQFVPVPADKGNFFTFENAGDGTWTAILEWPAREGKPARQKVYKMEPWTPGK